MIRFAPLSLLFGLALLTQIDSLLLAEPAQSPLPADIQNDLGFFVGEWRAEGDVLDMDLKGRWIAKWAPARHCLLITYPLTLDGQEMTGHGVMGWDSAAKELLVQMFYSDGTMETARYKQESPGLFKGSFAGSANGESSKAACEVRTNRPNEWTFTTIGRTGGTIPGELVVRFVRRETTPPAGAEKKQGKKSITKEQFIELGNRLVGQWVIESPLPIDVEKIGKAGDVLTDNRTFEWVSNQTALLETRIYRCNGKVVLEGVVLTAWEGPSQQVKSMYIDALGGSYQFSWSRRGEDWILRYEGVFGDGLKNSGKSRMTFSADGDTIRCHDTEIIYGDKQLPDQKLIFHRVKK